MVKTIPTAAVMEGVRILCGITSARANSHIAKEVCPEMKESPAGQKDFTKALVKVQSPAKISV